MSNRSVYRRAIVVEEYATLRQLQPPEQRVLDLLQADLAGARMLDIGVGGGRTTVHFADVVGEYVGVDYAEEMVLVCRKRFPGDRHRFEVGDARDLARFETDSFDFVLFSFNGIDDMSPADRWRTLCEIARVTRPGGRFCFSSHNLQGLDLQQLLFRRQMSGNPVELAENLLKWLLLRVVFNRCLPLRRLMDSPSRVVYRFDHSRPMPTHYIRPTAQITQVSGLFRDVRVFSLRTGEEVSGEANLAALDDPWLYYLCVVR